MSTTEKDVLDYAQFVTDKFADNHKPWVYKDTSEGTEIEHIRYKRDSLDYYSTTERLKRFIRGITTEHFKPNKKSIFYSKLNWFERVKLEWNVEVVKEANLPDGTVGSIITNWMEDGHYIVLFGPTVGREVLNFINADPTNMYARKIVDAMMEVHAANWEDAEDNAA